MKYWLGLALTGWASHAFAQTEIDALRYSQLQFGGGARTLGIGGANVALGADMGNLSSNPAGLGFFQRSEVSITPGFTIGTTDSRYGLAGTSATDSRNNLNIGNAGFIFTNRLADSDNTSNWRSGSFGVGVTRINNFNSQFSYQGSIGDNQSLLQYFREAPTTSYDNIFDQGNTQRYSDIDGLAYGAYITDLQEDVNGTERLVASPRQGPIQQNERVTNRGSQTQYDFAYGASYRDKLYVGGAIGIVSTRYDRIRDYQESEASAGTNFESLYLRDQQESRGTGFNLRIGAIYRASDYLRVGASVQTPTWYRLTDTFTNQLSSVFSPGLSTVNGTITSGNAGYNSQYTYSLTTPFRANGGVAVILGKYGFLSGDVEYLNYSQARLSGDANSGGGLDDFSAENAATRSLYRSTVNVRLGGEARYEAFRFRLGYAHYGDPYQLADDRGQNYYTAGLGIRQNRFFVDLAGVYKQSARNYSPYALADLNNTPVIRVKDNQFTTSITVGTTF